jgi:hypothetical protein
MTISIWILFAVLLLAPGAAFRKSRRLDWRAILLLICTVTLLLAHV